MSSIDMRKMSAEIAELLKPAYVERSEQVCIRREGKSQATKVLRIGIIGEQELFLTYPATWYLATYETMAMYNTEPGKGFTGTIADIVEGASLDDILGCIRKCLTEERNKALAKLSQTSRSLGSLDMLEKLYIEEKHGENTGLSSNLLSELSQILDNS